MQMCICMYVGSRRPWPMLYADIRLINLVDKQVGVRDHYNRVFRFL